MGSLHVSSLGFLTARQHQNSGAVYMAAQSSRLISYIYILPFYGFTLEVIHCHFHRVLLGCRPRQIKVKRIRFYLLMGKWQGSRKTV